MLKGRLWRWQEVLEDGRREGDNLIRLHLHLSGESKSLLRCLLCLRGRTGDT